MDPNAYLDQEYVNQFFQRQRNLIDNQTCFQCNTKNPSWCSVILGVFICYNCTTMHRSLGTHLSFVRSTELDRWTIRQLTFIEKGGNKRAREFFRQHGVTGNIDYAGSVAQRWRNELQEEVSAVYPKDQKSIQRNEIKESEEIKLPEPQAIVEEKPKPVQVAKPVRVQARPKYQTQMQSSARKFKKGKTDNKTQGGSKFKPVRFRAQDEDDEFEEVETIQKPVRQPPTPQQPVAQPVPVSQREEPVKKHFSSEEHGMGRAEESALQFRLQQIGHNNAISSADLFQRDETGFQESSSKADVYMQMAGDKMIEIRDKAKNWWSTVNSRFS